MGESAPETAPVLGRVFHHHEYGAAPLATVGQPLDEPQHDQEDGGQNADLLVGGQQSNQGGGHTHDDQGEHQHGLAAQPVAIVPGNDAADGACQKADAEGGKRQQRADDGIVTDGKEQLAEDQGGSARVEQKIVALQGCTDEACSSDSFDEVSPLASPPLI